MVIFFFTVFIYAQFKHKG